MTDELATRAYVPRRNAATALAHEAGDGLVRRGNGRNPLRAMFDAPDGAETEVQSAAPSARFPEPIAALQGALQAYIAEQSAHERQVMRRQGMLPTSAVPLLSDMIDDVDSIIGRVVASTDAGTVSVVALVGRKLVYCANNFPDQTVELQRRRIDVHGRTNGRFYAVGPDYPTIYQQGGVVAEHAGVPTVEHPTRDHIRLQDPTSNASEPAAQQYVLITAPGTRVDMWRFNPENERRENPVVGLSANSTVQLGMRTGAARLEFVPAHNDASQGQDVAVVRVPAALAAGAGVIVGAGLGPGNASMAPAMYRPTHVDMTLLLAPLSPSGLAPREATAHPSLALHGGLANETCPVNITLRVEGEGGQHRDVCLMRRGEFAAPAQDLQAQVRAAGAEMGGTSLQRQQGAAR